MRQDGNPNRPSEKQRLFGTEMGEYRLCFVIIHRKGKVNRLDSDKKSFFISTDDVSARFLSFLFEGHSLVSHRWVIKNKVGFLPTQRVMYLYSVRDTQLLFDC